LVTTACDGLRPEILDAALLRTPRCSGRRGKDRISIQEIDDYIDRIVVLLISLCPIIFLSIASSVASSRFPRLFHINSCRLYFVIKINRSNLAGP
jgi:hypothetical protein